MGKKTNDENTVSTIGREKTLSVTHGTKSNTRTKIFTADACIGASTTTTLYPGSAFIEIPEAGNELVGGEKIEKYETMNFKELVNEDKIILQHRSVLQSFLLFAESFLKYAPAAVVGVALFLVGSSTYSLETILGVVGALAVFTLIFIAINSISKYFDYKWGIEEEIVKAFMEKELEKAVNRSKK